MCTKRKQTNNKDTEGYGLIDYIVNKLPEIHIPGYQYCGPGTQLEKRLARGDTGINQLDQACKRHDIAYSTLRNSKSRRKADKILISQAIPRIYSRDAKFGERAAALLVSSLMGAKVGLSKIGLGLGIEKRRHKRKNMSVKTKKLSMQKSSSKKKSTVKKRNSPLKKKYVVKKTKEKKQKSISFSKLVHGVRAEIKNSETKSPSLEHTIKAAIRHARDVKRNKKVEKIPRILKLPKYGGSITPILPILSALSAIGSISSSALGIVKTIKKIENARGQMHGRKTEKKIGRRLYLTRNAKGSGFYLKPYHQH